MQNRWWYSSERRASLWKTCWWTKGIRIATFLFPKIHLYGLTPKVQHISTVWLLRGESRYCVVSSNEMRTIPLGYAACKARTFTKNSASRSRKKVFFYHCLQQFWSKVGNTTLLNQQELFLVLANDELTFLAINLSKQVVVTFVCLFHANVGNRMTADRQLRHHCFFLPFTPYFQMIDNRSLHPTRPLLRHTIFRGYRSELRPVRLKIFKAKTAKVPLYRQMERSFLTKRDKNMC